MSSTVAAAGVAALCCVSVSPYLACLARRAPDRSDRLWWRWEPGPAAVGRIAPLAASLGALGGAAAGLSAALPAFIVLAAICAPLIVIDVDAHRLPDRLVFAAAAAAVLLLPVAAVQRHDVAAAVRAAGAAVAEFAVLLGLALLAPASFGFGDVKLGGVLGGYLGWFGWQHVYCGLVAGFVLGSVTAVVLIGTGRASLKSAMPFGPMLVLGALCVPAFGLVAAP